MAIHVYTRPPNPWDDASDRAAAAGYVLEHIAGPKLLKDHGNEGGPFGVFKDGELLARFNSPVARDKWLHEKLAELRND